MKPTLAFEERLDDTGTRAMETIRHAADTMGLKTTGWHLGDEDTDPAMPTADHVFVWEGDTPFRGGVFQAIKTTNQTGWHVGPSITGKGGFEVDPLGTGVFAAWQQKVRLDHRRGTAVDEVWCRGTGTQLLVG